MPGKRFAVCVVFVAFLSACAWIIAGGPATRSVRARAPMLAKAPARPVLAAKYKLPLGNVWTNIDNGAYRSWEDSNLWNLNGSPTVLFPTVDPNATIDIEIAGAGAINPPKATVTCGPLIFHAPLFSSPGVSFPFNITSSSLDLTVTACVIACVVNGDATITQVMHGDPNIVFNAIYFDSSHGGAISGNVFATGAVAFIDQSSGLGFSPAGSISADMASVLATLYYIGVPVTPGQTFTVRGMNIRAMNSFIMQP